MGASGEQTVKSGGTPVTGDHPWDAAGVSSVTPVPPVPPVTQSGKRDADA